MRGERILGVDVGGKSVAPERHADGSVAVRMASAREYVVKLGW